MNNNFKTVTRFDSSDTNVSKFVFKNDTSVAEAVLYKYPTYEERTVICCSTMSGCPVACRFCGAGDYFVRNFTADEIVEQPKYLLDQIGVNAAIIKKLQIMFMSMGEPMLNWREMKVALRKLNVMYPNAKLLISTSAPVVSKNFEELAELSKEIKEIGLQFSVHESTNESRKKLIPTNTMTLEQISKTGEYWYSHTKRKPFFNYCVHDKNNSQQDAERLRAHFNPNIWECTISVICERDEHIAAANERQRELAQNFSNMMLERGFGVRVFNPSGQDDIGGGCGQLWFVQNWMKENPDLTKPSKGLSLPKIHTPK